MSRTAITDALADWVSGVTNRVPIFDWQNRQGPRPDDIACAMILGTTHHGFGEIEMVDIDGDPPIPDPVLVETSRVQGTLFVSMDLFGDETLRDMNLLRASVNLSRYAGLFEGANMGFARVGDIRDIAAIVKNEPESRHQADWEFNIQTSISDDIFSIESATITGNGTSITVEKV